MYSKFTDHARKVVMLANQEAQRFHHDYLGAEHLLLGLIKEGSGVAGLQPLEPDSPGPEAAVDSRGVMHWPKGG